MANILGMGFTEWQKAYPYYIRVSFLVSQPGELEDYCKELSLEFLGTRNFDFYFSESEGSVAESKFFLVTFHPEKGWEVLDKESFLVYSGNLLQIKEEWRRDRDTGGGGRISRRMDF